MIGDLWRPNAWQRRTRVMSMGALACAAVLCALAGCESASMRGSAVLMSETQAWSFGRAKGTVVTTEHYEIYTTTRDPMLIDASVRMCEGQYQRIHDVLSITPTSKMKVYLFATRGQWEEFTKATLGARGPEYLRIRDGGYSVGGMAAVYYLKRYPTLAVLGHEVFHQYVDAATDVRVPAWANEGLATWFESHEWDDVTPVFTPKKNMLRCGALARGLKNGEAFTLRELLATHAGQVAVLPKPKVAMYYAQLWALVRFLKEGDGTKRTYTTSFETFVTEFGSQQMTSRAGAYLATHPQAGEINFGEAVFRGYFTDDVDGFERAYQAYCQRLINACAM